jgi:hypothetical protein
VLHRLFASGSDRAAERWREDYLIPGTEALELHDLYRAMAFLGQEGETKGQKSLGAPRCLKDLIKEELFERRRDLFTEAICLNECHQDCLGLDLLACLHRNAKM